MSSPGPPKKVDSKLAAARKDIEEKRKAVLERKKLIEQGIAQVGGESKIPRPASSLRPGTHGAAASSEPAPAGEKVEHENYMEQEAASIKVMFIGRVPELPLGFWVGIKYDEPVGKNDGSVKGVRYFE